MTEPYGLMRQRQDKSSHSDIVWVAVNQRPVPFSADAYIDAGYAPGLEQLPWLHELLLSDA